MSARLRGSPLAEARRLPSSRTSISSGAVADDDAKPSPSTTIPDPFAGAKASLRDTIKWLATTFAAVIGVVIAGTSLSGISKLTGINLELALSGGIVGLAC